MQDARQRTCERSEPATPSENTRQAVKNPRQAAKNPRQAKKRQKQHKKNQKNNELGLVFWILDTTNIQKKAKAKGQKSQCQ